MTPVAVFLPVGEGPAKTSIRRGSGIVGRTQQGHQAVIWYEGAIYGQTGLERLVDRVARAFDRMVVNYPTIAKMVVPRDELAQVGEYDPETRRITLGPGMRWSVARWLELDGDDQLDAQLG